MLPKIILQSILLHAAVLDRDVSGHYRCFSVPRWSIPFQAAPVFFVLALPSGDGNSIRGNLEVVNRRETILRLYSIYLAWLHIFDSLRIPSGSVEAA